MTKMSHNISKNCAKIALISVHFRNASVVILLKFLTVVDWGMAPGPVAPLPLDYAPGEKVVSLAHDTILAGHNGRRQRC